MSTMVKMYIHVLLVDIHESLFLENVNRISLNKIIKCSNTLLISDLIRPRTCTCNSEVNFQALN